MDTSWNTRPMPEFRIALFLLLLAVELTFGSPTHASLLPQIAQPELAACRTDIDGIVFNDANANGVQDPSEAGVPGVKLSVKRANTGVLLRTTHTDAAGHYLFKTLGPGERNVILTLPSGYSPTTPKQKEVELPPCRTVNFGIKRSSAVTSTPTASATRTRTATSSPTLTSTMTGTATATKSPTSTSTSDQHFNCNFDPNGNQYTDGNANGDQYANGHANGNQYPDGHANGKQHPDGHANGNQHSDGHADGHQVLRRTRQQKHPPDLRHPLRLLHRPAPQLQLSLRRQPKHLPIRRSRPIPRPSHRRST